MGGGSNFASSVHLGSRGAFSLGHLSRGICHGGAYVGGDICRGAIDVLRRRKKRKKKRKKEGKRRKEKHISAGRNLSEQDSVGTDLTDSI